MSAVCFGPAAAIGPAIPRALPTVRASHPLRPPHERREPNGRRSVPPHRPGRAPGCGGHQRSALLSVPDSGTCSALAQSGTMPRCGAQAAGTRVSSGSGSGAAYFLISQDSSRQCLEFQDVWQLFSPGVQRRLAAPKR